MVSDFYLNLSLLLQVIFIYLIFFFNVGILVYNLEIILTVIMITVIIKVLKMTIKHPKNSYQ